jgi:hypothetical protein
MIGLIVSLALILILIIVLTCAPINELLVSQTSNLHTIPTLNECIVTPTAIHTEKVFRIFSDFSSSEVCNRNYNKNKYDSMYDNIKFTTNDDYTHAILINKAMPNLSIPKENVIGFSVEPPYYLNIDDTFINYVEKNVSAYYIGDLNYNTTKLKQPFRSQIGFIWHSPLQQVLSPKIGFMSIIFSDKKETPGQCYRHSLVEAILKTNLPIDIFGRGCEYLSQNNDQRIKGKFNGSKPYQNYKFTIAIENFALSHYVSEKFIDAMMFETIPLYYGASCIDTYFENQFIRLSGNILEDMELIQFVVDYPNDLELTKINRFKAWKKFNLIEHVKEQYNIIDDKPNIIGIPFGMFCSAAYSLDFAHLRTYSFPFDWNQLSISTIMEILNLSNSKTDVEYFYSKLFQSLDIENRDPISQSWFPHDKNDQETLSKYTRRTLRLNEIIQKSNERLIFLTILDSKTTLDDFVKLQQFVLSKTLSKDVTFFVIMPNGTEYYDSTTNTFYWNIDIKEFKDDNEFHRHLGDKIKEFIF